ncbi:DNA topoisomerase (ATP-hydrolyzing) subunit B [Arsenicibacter rosenii]|uniref:DNA gyrase subunit B n=1 Tax=Arsenicibacter rosenii TaxID=1750698 RepID=A0A193DRM0_9BACT|nr:DNA topoisomerase (ATP-hydrolyzing) subunit B [Arsenicibacter rosenii]ANN44506.1 DNA gyrase subunit B [Arsenicibacter rosenii]OIN56964.1 DNA gyrase subunit B [Arsenicibacter rosenii]
MTNEIIDTDVLTDANDRSNYGASNIQVLEGLEAVRKRPAMYIGDVGIKGLHHLIWEVVDNSIDEALAGYCDTIHVTINEDNSITVRDNGRGIPTGLHKTGKSALEVVMTVLHAGGKFDKDTYKVSGGLHGVGVSCVNALSTHLRVEVHRDGKVFEQEYQTGHPMYDVREIGTADDTGTIVRFKPDGSIFTETVYRYETVAGRLRELAFLNKGIRITLTDLREKDENGEPINRSEFLSEGGLIEFVKYLDQSRPSLEGMDPVYMESDKGSTPVQVALVYNMEAGENISSYVNNINTIEGGTHVQGFRTALTRVLKNYADKNAANLPKNAGKVTFDGGDFRKGLTAVISVKVAEPQFEGQTKTKLGNSDVVSAVSQAMSDMLETWLEENPKIAQSIIRKVLISAQARIAAELAYKRIMTDRKDFMSGMGLPGKLADCSDTDPRHCELYLVEGDSAGGSAKQGRNRAFQAILPLRGKILNVEKAMEHKIYENEEIKNIITALGIRLERVGDETVMNLDKLRYHKIIIMTDADVDGSHIRTLILTLFFRHLRLLIEHGYVYIAQPPLYLVKKGKEERYCWTEAQREVAVREIAGAGREENVHVQRYKGLGEMNPEQLWSTTMDPDKRSLKQVTIESAADADHVFSMLMGDDVAPRRDFIERNAKYARIDI